MENVLYPLNMNSKEDSHKDTPDSVRELIVSSFWKLAFVGELFFMISIIALTIETLFQIS